MLVPLQQQLGVNWLPQETRVGMWLAVPQPYEARKRKSLVLSHPGTWLKVLGGQPGSLDQTLVITSRSFQTKQKNLIFFGFEDLLCFFRAEREPQRAFLCFPLKTVLLAADHLSCAQALKCIFSLCPCLPFLPTEETGCVSPSAIPAVFQVVQISQWGQGQGTASSTHSLWGESSSTPTELQGEPSGSVSYPSTSFLFLIVKIQLCLLCMLSSVIFRGWAGLLVHPWCLDHCSCGHGVNICLNPLYPKEPWGRPLLWPTLRQFVKLQPPHVPMRRDF